MYSEGRMLRQEVVAKDLVKRTHKLIAGKFKGNKTSVTINQGTFYLRMTNDGTIWFGSGEKEAGFAISTPEDVMYSEYMRCICRYSNPGDRVLYQV